MKFLKKLYQTIVNTPKDKLLHFIVGFAIGIVSMLIASILYSYGFISLEPYKYSLLALSLIGAGSDNYRVVGLEIKGGFNFTIEPNINYVGDLPLSDGLYQFQLVTNSPNWEANLFQVQTEPEVPTNSGYAVAAYEGVNVTHPTDYSSAVPFSNTIIDEDVLFTKMNSNFILQANQAGYYKISVALKNFSGLSLAQLGTQTDAQQMIAAHDDWKIGVAFHKNGLSEALMMTTLVGGNQDYGTLYLAEDDQIGVIISNIKALALGTPPATKWEFESVVITIEKID